MFHFGNKVLFGKILKMSTLERVLCNNKAAEELLQSLKRELSAIKNELVIKKKKELTLENSTLAKQVEIAKSQLINLETLNGKTQIPIPGDDKIPSENLVQNELNKVNQVEIPTGELQKPQKEKKIKKEKPQLDSNVGGGGSKKAAEPEASIDVGRLDFRVGKIIDVSKHPDADSLYLEKIDCGEDKARTVISGLVKFIPIEEMQNRMVVVLCNLKPVKMRGIMSEAMVMCASTPDKVEVLSPPDGAVPGDLVHCNGYDRKPDAQLNPKKKIFETCAPDLMTNGELIACYKGEPLQVIGKGKVLAQSLKNVNVK